MLSNRRADSLSASLYTHTHPTKQTGYGEFFYITDPTIVPFNVHKTERYVGVLKNNGIQAIEAYVCSSYLYNGEPRAEFHFSMTCYPYADGYLTPAQEWGKKTCRFNFFNDNTNYVEFNTVHYEKQHPTPRKASVVTPQVINAWGDWLSKRLAAAEEFFSERDNKIDLFLALVKAAKQPSDKCDENRGEITRGQLSFSYVIDHENKTINTEVRIDPKLKFADLQTFLLSPNTQTL